MSRNQRGNNRKRQNRGGGRSAASSRARSQETISVYDYDEGVWPDEEASDALTKSQRKAKKRKERIRRNQERDRQLHKDIVSFLQDFDIVRYRERARELDRRFVLHIGPTNSGKTYDSLQALKAARTGVYLGPLRLLALEMFDTLNAQGVLCELLTGEEFIRTPGAQITASTIELCNFNKRYDVAVIDEAQMISDASRGGNWTKAVFLVDAAEVHICLAPEAEHLICRILDSFDADYEIHRHERLAPLVFTGKLDSIEQVRDGDAVIVFSRRSVLATAGELQALGKKASVIYGALPPASRREEVRKFASGENTVVVSTDAIGMGISLPIKRIVFRELTKFDGEDDRTLTGDEIRQIAGRAGRYGIYDMGEVLSMAEPDTVAKALQHEGKPLRDVTIPFPREAIDTGYSFQRLFHEWDMLPIIPGFAREDMSEARFLLNELGDVIARTLDRQLLYELITCPVDIKNEQLVLYWLESVIAISVDAIPEVPMFGTDTLEGCELQYKALDVRHQLLRRIGIEDPRMDEKLELCEKINQLLLTDKRNFRKRCRLCGRSLPADWPYGICDQCFHRGRPRGRRRR